MSLSGFSENEVQLLASLPYKIGIWISHTDDEDGEADDRREAKALELCLHEFIKAYKDKPFICAVLKETLRDEQNWPQWADQSFTVLNDVKSAVVLLRQKTSKDDFRSFCGLLSEIGSAVAEAHGEFNSFEDEKSKGFLSKLVGKLAGLSTEDEGHPMNVSAAEDGALGRLADVLKM
jgi:hypothetical protein